MKWNAMAAVFGGKGHVRLAAWTSTLLSACVLTACGPGYDGNYDWGEGEYDCYEEECDYEDECVWDGTCEDRIQSERDVGAHATSSSSRMAVSSDDEQLFIALADRNELAVVDASSPSLAPDFIPLDGTPHRVTALRSGDVAVSLRDEGAVAFVDPNTGQKRKVIVGASPYGMLEIEPYVLAVAVSGQNEVVIVNELTDEVTRRIPTTARDPRGLAIRGDGKLVVSHFSPGRLSLINLDTDTVEIVIVPDHELGRANQIEQIVAGDDPKSVHFPLHLCNDDPAQFTEEGGTFVTDEELPPSAYYINGTPAVVGAAATSRVEFGDDGALLIDTDTDVFNPLQQFGVDRSVGVSALAMLDDEAYRLLVHRFTGSVTLRQTTELYSWEDAVVNVGVGADSIAVSSNGTQAWVFNPFEQSVSSIQLAYLDDGGQGSVTGNASEPVRIAEQVLDPGVVLGRELFFTVDERLTTAQAIACASCHPDGQDDGITWQFAEGPRQTQPLWGDVLGSGSLHWDQAVENLDDLNQITVIGRMGGNGLTEDELSSLGEYLSSIPTPAPPMDLNPLAVGRGQALFESDAVGCTECHTGPSLTDGLAHSVGTSAEDLEREELTEIATPHLRGLASSAPYMHDGSATSLHNLVLMYVQTDRMGHGSQLTEGEVDDLVAYLKSL